VKGPAQMTNEEAEKDRIDMQTLAMHSGMANSAQHGSMGAGGAVAAGTAAGASAEGTVVRHVMPAGQGLTLVICSS